MKGESKGVINFPLYSVCMNDSESDVRGVSRDTFLVYEGNMIQKHKVRFKDQR